MEVRVSYSLTATANVILSGNTSNSGTGSANTQLEVGETTIKNNAQSSPVYTNSSYVAQNNYVTGYQNLVKFSMCKATATPYANYYTFDSVFSWSGVGACRTSGMGDFQGTIGSIILTCSTGNINGTYTTIHYY